MGLGSGHQVNKTPHVELLKTRFGACKSGGMLEACHSTSLPQWQILLEYLVPRSQWPHWTAPHTVRGQYFSCQAFGTPCYYHFSSLKLAHIQDTWSVQQLVLTTLPFSNMPQWSIYLLFFLAHSSLYNKTDDNKLLFLLATSLLKEQMPEVSRMAVNCIPLQPHLPLRASPPTSSLPPTHCPCFQEAAIYELAGVWDVWVKASPQSLASIYPKSLVCLMEIPFQAPGIHIQKESGMFGCKFHPKPPPLGVYLVQTPPLRKPTKWWLPPQRCSRLLP